MILKGGTHDMKLGQTILDIRKERKMTQEEFAQIFNVTRQTVSNWEKEKNYPDLETLIFMSDEFNISLDVMLKENKKMVKKLNKEITFSKRFKKNAILIILATSIRLTGYIPSAVLLSSFPSFHKSALLARRGCIS